MRRLVLAAFILILCAAAFVGFHSAEERDPRTVRIAYLPTTHALPLIAQQEKTAGNGTDRLNQVLQQVLDELRSGNRAAEQDK